MCGCEFAITTDVRRHDDLACGRLRADYLAFVLKGTNDLHAEINDHCCFARRREMVKEAIMTVGPQSFMAAEKLPDKGKRRLPCSPNLTNAHAGSHCGKRLLADAFSNELIVHRKFPFEFNLGDRRRLAPELTRHEMP